MTRTVVMEITRMEATHLGELVRQFRELLQAEDPGTGRPSDDALLRLVPDAYRDDPAAAEEFRHLTADDILARRDTDADEVLRTLADPSAAEESEPLDVMVVDLSLDQVESWLRTLAALRLVLASRLGIHSESDHDPADPRFGIYEWLGYRLEMLLEATEDD
jgi:hypothetical protein